jgi:hypothetical protein
MRPLDLHLAAFRLQNVSMPSATTEAALRITRRNPSEAALIGHLASRRSAPAALTLLSALRSDSEVVFEAVADSIRRDPCLSWALVESLNELPWYNGLRAFLSLPDNPLSSPSAYPFYILVRNKVFVTPDASVSRYDYHVKALWHTLAVAKDANWQRPEAPAVTMAELLCDLLEKPHPDPFVVYFASLLFGQVAPVSTSIQTLRARLGKDCCPPVRAAAALTLRHMDSNGVSDIRHCARPSKKAAMRVMKALAALLTF